MNGNDSDGSGEEEGKTPKDEKSDVVDPGSGGGRTTRGICNTQLLTLADQG